MNKEGMQKAFDKAVSGILAQGGPSGHAGPTKNTYMCSYIEGTRRCAFGHLVSEGLSMELLEGKRAESIMTIDGADIFGNDVKEAAKVVQNDIRNNYGPLETTFIGALQAAHDSAARDRSRLYLTDADFINAFRIKVEEIALRYHLKTNVLET
jgi:hypothetical protein